MCLSTSYTFKLVGVGVACKLCTCRKEALTAVPKLQTLKEKIRDYLYSVGR